MLQDTFWGSLGLGRCDTAARATMQAVTSDDFMFCKACGAVTRTWSHILLTRGVPHMLWWVPFTFRSPARSTANQSMASFSFGTLPAPRASINASGCAPLWTRGHLSNGSKACKT